MAAASAVAAFEKCILLKPPAACTSPAKSRATQPTSARNDSLHATSVLTLTVPNSGFCHASFCPFATSFTAAPNLHERAATYSFAPLNSPMFFFHISKISIGCLCTP
ncbi:hypothetical protein ACFX11_014132 [Malus domestica]